MAGRKRKAEIDADVVDQLTAIATRGTNKVDIQKAVELRLKGLTLEEIARQFGCSKQSVHKALKPYQDINPEALHAFKVGRADLLAGFQLRLIQSVTDEDLKKMSPRDKFLAFGILFDKERLERGQSTVNTALFSVIVGEACKASG
jgi:AraC-like DNA-binding protein